MGIETMRAFFGWCSIINGGILILSFLVFCFAADWVFRIHGKWFPITRRSFNVVFYCFMGAMKLVVVFLNLVPYIVLTMIA